MLQISEIAKQPEDMFDLFNDHFYNGELTRPAITVSPDGGRGKLGSTLKPLHNRSKSSRPSSRSRFTAYRSHSSGVGISPAQGIRRHCACFSGSGSFQPVLSRSVMSAFISSIVMFLSRANLSKIVSGCSMPKPPQTRIMFPSFRHAINIMTLLGNSQAT